MLYGSLFLSLALFWWFLSGYTYPMLIGLGLVSVIATLLLTKRLGLLSFESHPITLIPKLIRFWILLFIEILKSNWDVVLTVLGFRQSSPCTVELSLAKNSDLTKVLFANSVTLTPGTVSVWLEEDKLIVHSLHSCSEHELANSKLSRFVTQTTNEKVAKEQE